ncbi:unnamed protein product [Dicrocoelium dendriticum]|nr:unnamed protein product [Dicrocoelium dendriticum]
MPSSKPDQTPDQLPVLQDQPDDGFRGSRHVMKQIRTRTSLADRNMCQPRFHMNSDQSTECDSVLLSEGCQIYPQPAEIYPEAHNLIHHTSPRHGSLSGLTHLNKMTAPGIETDLLVAGHRQTHSIESHGTGIRKRSFPSDAADRSCPPKKRFNITWLLSMDANKQISPPDPRR